MRPGAKTIASSLRLATEFNSIVQWNILFYKDFIISHLVDEAIRWTSAALLPSRSAVDIIQSITHNWIRLYGPMRLLVSDQESGIMGDACNLWLDRQQIQVKTKEPGTHAHIVERHHDLLRRVLHTTEAQLAEEGVDMPFEVTLAECTLAKNVMLSVAGFSPYQALCGRLPQMMANFEPSSDVQLVDDVSGIIGASRHHHRVREIALASMVEMIAKQRIERAAKTQTRRSIE